MTADLIPFRPVLDCLCGESPTLEKIHKPECAEHGLPAMYRYKCASCLAHSPYADNAGRAGRHWNWGIDLLTATLKQIEDTERGSVK